MKTNLINIISDSLKHSELNEIKKDFSVLLKEIEKSNRNILINNVSVTKDFFVRRNKSDS